MGNNCHAVAVRLLKYLKNDNQPAQVELAAQQVATAMTKAQCSLVALRPLPCDIVAAGWGQRKVEVAAKKQKKVTINRRCG